MSDIANLNDVVGTILQSSEPIIYGIWMPENDDRGLGDWFVLAGGEIFYTIYRAVAEAQLQYVIKRVRGSDYSVIEVREFPSLID